MNSLSPYFSVQLNMRLPIANTIGVKITNPSTTKSLQLIVLSFKSISVFVVCTFFCCQDVVFIKLQYGDLLTFLSYQIISNKVNNKNTVYIIALPPYPEYKVTSG